MSLVLTTSIDPVRPMATPEADYSMFLRRDAQGRQIMDFAVDGITCAACIGEIETALTAEQDIAAARLNLTDHRVRVTWRDDTATPNRVIARLRKIGYRAYPFDPAAMEERESAALRELLLCLGVAAFSTMNIMLLSVSVWSGNATDIDPLTRDFFHWLSAVIAVPTVAYAGRPFFRSALRALRSGGMNMDVPISLGVSLAVAMSLVEVAHHAEHAYFDSACMLLFFLLIGRTLEHVMRRRTRAVAGNLLALRSETALRQIAPGKFQDVPIAAITKGDIVMVRPGERISVDGVVLAGTSLVDQSLITGETAPIEVRDGSMVNAGTMNLTGAMTLRVAAAGHASFLEEVNRLLGQAGEERSRYVQLADRAARLYSPVVHIAALATFLGWQMLGLAWQPSLIIAITVLIITCPCALGLAIPTVQVVASGAMFRSQILLNGGDALERLADVDTVIFDKTGTLTLPTPDIVNRDAVPPHLLTLAGRLALSSRHPLATALADALHADDPLDNAVEAASQGVSACHEGKEARLGRPSFCGFAEDTAPDNSFSRIAVQWGDERAIIDMRQTLRPDAVATLKRLRAMGFSLSILSGDHKLAVSTIATELGIDDWQSELRPDAKIAVIKARQQAGHRVLMVGDGLNDAPALAAAHVSLSPVTAVHLAQAQADAVFLGRSLTPVADALAIGRKARALMMQNLWLAVVYNAIAVPIAILGWVTPLIAALAMSGSSVIVTLNALRARTQQRSEPMAPAASTDPVEVSP